MQCCDLSVRPSVCPIYCVSTRYAAHPTAVGEKHITSQRETLL